MTDAIKVNDVVQIKPEHAVHAYQLMTVHSVTTTSVTGIILGINGIQRIRIGDVSRIGTLRWISVVGG